MGIQGSADSDDGGIFVSGTLRYVDMAFEEIADLLTIGFEVSQVVSRSIHCEA